MVKYIITKSGKELKAIGTFARHEDLMKDNGLTSNDVIDEGYIIEGLKVSIHNGLNDNLLKARIIESEYHYGIKRIGD